MTLDSRPLALVTGASSGIGRELAIQLAARDYELVVAAEDADISRIADGIRSSGATASAVQADLATESGVDQVVTEVQRLGRPVDVLCLNAGVGNAGPFVETSLEDDLRLIDLNIAHVVHTAKRLLPAMVQRGEGRVLITSSVASLMPGPWYATYAASKSFLQSFAEAIRYELKDSGVTVTALLPGPTDTDFFDRANLDGSVADEGPKDDPADVARDGLEAMFDGDDQVVAGSWRNKVQAVVSKGGGPDRLKAAVHAQQTKQK